MAAGEVPSSTRGRSGLFAAGTALLLLSIATPPAHAAFVNGVERFEGPSLDTNTWEFYRRTGISHRADGLNLRIPSGANDYTTRAVTVGVGGFVQADVRLNAYLAPPGIVGLFGLYLTTNSGGTADTTDSDSEYLALVNTDYFDNIVAWHTDGVPITGYAIVDNAQPVGSTYRYRITRESHNTARYEVFEGERLLGALTRTFVEVPDDLFVSISASAVDITVRNVVVIPEPSSLGGAICLASLLLRWRQPRRADGSAAA